MNKILNIMPLLTGWAFALSFVYLWSYWQRFGINIFEFLSVGDVVIFASPTLIALTVFVSLLIGLGLGVIKLFERIFGSSKKEMLGTRIKRIAEIAFWISIAVLFLWFLCDWENWGVVIIAIFAGAVAVLLEQLALFKQLLPSPFGRRFVALLCAVSLVIAFQSGNDKYERVMSDKLERRVIESTFLLDQTAFKSPEFLIYIGKGGDYFFFSTEDKKKILITELSSFKSFQLREAIGTLASGGGTNMVTP